MKRNSKRRLADAKTSCEFLLTNAGAGCKSAGLDLSLKEIAYLIRDAIET
jgi:hypothetical protein